MTCIPNINFYLESTEYNTIQISVATEEVHFQILIQIK